MLPELPLARRCSDEMKLMGFSVSAHPLELLPSDIWRQATTAGDMESMKGRNVTMIGWAIASKPIHTRKKKRPMKFISLEDLTGTFEATLFPAVYSKYARLTLSAGPYRMRGRIEESQGMLSLIVSHLEVLKIEDLE